MFLGLRMTDGISTKEFQSRFGKPPAIFYPQIVNWLEGDFIVEQDGYLRLTKKGLMLANSIFVEFM